MEDILTKLGLALITILCFGLLSYILKKWLSLFEENIILKIDQVKKKQQEMNGSVKDVIEKHHACREELPKIYATKDTVNKIFDKLGPIHLDVKLIKKQIAEKEKRLAKQT